MEDSSNLKDLKAVILAGGFGTRLSEETDLKPKPMVQIGDKPILSHIMNFYQSYGHDEFIVAAGYKKEVITEYYKNSKEFENLTIVDTGENTMTGGRLKRVKEFLKDIAKPKWVDRLNKELNEKWDQLFKIKQVAILVNISKS